MAAGIEVLRTPPRSPDLNAYAERFFRSVKDECLRRMIFSSERQLRKAIGHYVEHYHHDRNHQGLENRLIEPQGESPYRTGKVVRDSRLGGLLNHYRRAAWVSSDFWDTTGEVQCWRRRGGLLRYYYGDPA